MPVQALGRSILEPRTLRWRIIAAFIWHFVAVTSAAWTLGWLLGGLAPAPGLVAASQVLGFAAQLPLYAPRPSPMLSVGSKLSPRLAVALARCLGPWTSFPWLASQLCAGLGLWVSALVVLLPAANTFWLAGGFAWTL